MAIETSGTRPPAAASEMAAPSPTPAKAESAAAIVEAARLRLHEAQAVLDAEIRAYPTPISGCDAQFNHLLAERRRVRAALRALWAQVHIPTPRAP